MTSGPRLLVSVSHLQMGHLDHKAHTMLAAAIFLISNWTGARTLRSYLVYYPPFCCQVRMHLLFILWAVFETGAFLVSRSCWGTHQF